MLRKLCFLASMLAVLGLANASKAYVFYSGIIDANAGAAGGGVAVPGAGRIGFADGGASYNNVWGTGAGGTSLVGNNLRAVGVIPLANANVGGGSVPFNSGNNLVAIFAISGTITNPGPLGATGNFQVESGNQGVMWIVDRSAAAGALNAGAPATWASNINNLAASTLATFAIADVPTGAFAGLPGPPTTQIPLVASLGNLNTASVDLSVPLSNAVAQFKVDITSLGTFFANPLVDDGDPNTVLTSLASLITLNLQLDSISQPSLGVDAADLAALNSIYNQLLGGQWATGVGGAAGSDYNPFSPTNPGTVNTGDSAEFATGGNLIPGGQFATVPEPASMIIWGSLAAAGAVAYRRRRKVNA